MPAEMSSLFIGQPDKVAARGNNGIVTDDYFHTGWEYGGWWRVDLEQMYCVTRVFFVNRKETSVFQFRK